MAYSNFRHLYDMGNHSMASIASLSCFSQNSNAYSFSSNENMTLKLNLQGYYVSVPRLLARIVDFPHFKLSGVNPK